MMYWPCVFFSIVTLGGATVSSLAGTVQLPVTYRVEGTIQREWHAPSGGVRTLTNWFIATVSNSCSAIRSGGMTDNAVDYFEYVCDGQDSSMLTKYVPRDATSVLIRRGGEFRKTPLKGKQATRNKATLMLNSGPVPEYGFGLISFVWIAYASAEFYSGQRTNYIDPVLDMGTGFRENELRVRAEWTLSPHAPALPEWMCDYGDGNQYSEEHGELIRKPFPKPFNSPMTNCVYEVLSWTNIGEVTLPSAWRLTEFRVNLEAKKYEIKAITTGITASADVQIPSGEFVIRGLADTRVLDRRLPAQGIPIRVVDYFSTNGSLLTLDQLRARPEFRPALADGLGARLAATKRRTTLLVIVAIFGFPSVFLLWNALRRKKGSASTEIAAQSRTHE